MIKDLKEQNISIFYITHRLSEVFEISTHVAIMRDGQITLNGPIKDFTKEMLIKGLLPPQTKEKEKSNTATYNEINYNKLKPVFELKDFTGYGFSNLNLEVYPGEVLGVAGVVGAGRTEFATTVFGMDKCISGKVYLEGEDITGKKTKDIIKRGINYVPEDRFLNGIFKISNITLNTTSSTLNYLSKIFLNSKLERKITQKYIDDFRTKVVGQEQTIGSLSGGNQQKVVIARALTTTPKLIILDEPTRGIDAGARSDVYNIINNLKEQGLAVLLISSDLEEIEELSDRVVTMFQGKINKCFAKNEINQDNLMSASFNVFKEDI